MDSPLPHPAGSTWTTPVKSATQTAASSPLAPYRPIALAAPPSVQQKWYPARIPQPATSELWSPANSGLASPENDSASLHTTSPYSTVSATCISGISTQMTRVMPSNWKPPWPKSFSRKSWPPKISAARGFTNMDVASMSLGKFTPGPSPHMQTFHLDTRTFPRL